MIRALPLITIAAATLSGCSPQPMSSDPQTDDGSASTEAACEAALSEATNIDALFAAYEANEATAQRDYGGRCLLVVGIVDSVELDISDEPFIVLRTVEGETSNARLQEIAFAAAANVTKGELAYLLCRDVSEFLGSPSLHECTFAPVGSASAR